MVDYQTLSIVFTGLSISIAAFYYISTLRNTRKNQQLQLETRQTQLFMQIYQQLSSEESMATWAELLNDEFDDYDEYMRKYDSTVNPRHFGKRGHIWYTYNSIGYLLEDGLIPIDLAYKLVGTLAILQWQKWGDMILEIRERQSYPTYFEGFSYLVNELTKYHNEHPELRT